MFANKKEHRHKLFLIWVLAGFFFINNANSQELPDSVTYQTIATALNSGDIEQIAPLLYTKVEIALPDKAGIYSQAQAYYILKDFFEKNHPTSFQIINESSTNKSNFIVGKMHTATQHFRICYLTKYSDNKLYIYQFSVEK